MSTNVGLPAQQLPLSRKTKEWRKKHLTFASTKTFFNYSLVRKTVLHKKINYDLLNGKIHMSDLTQVLNPYALNANFIPDKIQHYPIINSSLNVLQGEESRRVFDYKVIVTNPNAISEKENTKKQELVQKLQEWVSNTAQSEEEAQQELQKLGDYFSYEWQDMREVRANCLLNHYVKELDIPAVFNAGFVDGMAVGEEIYQCDIVGGEPTFDKINPLKIRVLKSGFSNKIEDADMIILEDYWSPGKVVDTYHDVLQPKDRKSLEEGFHNMGDNEDNTRGEYEMNEFIPKSFVGEDGVATDEFYWDPIGGHDSISASESPYDYAGNVRVLRVYWKSRRKIKKVKSYDQITGDEIYDFYSENYIPDTARGEEETIYWINQAWEGTKIGKDIYLNMRPKPVQYNRLTNPSICHFGIIGSIYNINDARPFSLVDMMKPYNYLYDVIHDRLNKLISRNWGNMVELDLAKKPNEWTTDKWLYFAKTLGLYVTNSFNEGGYGAAAGKIAGALNNASRGVIPAADTNSIQQYMNLLEWIKREMADVTGINDQRKGQVQNRETVGGVERATLQSSHITEWLFIRHESVKKRALECFLETAKIALKGRSKKFQYLLSDGSTRIMEIDGDEFAEADYGLVVDNSNGTQELNQKLDSLAQAALQNQLLNFSTIMKLYTSTSLSEKQRMVELNEQRTTEMNQQQQQQQMQIQQQQMEQQAQTAQQQMEMQYKMHQEDNETKILVAEINSKAEADRLALINRDTETEYTDKDKAELSEKARQFNEHLVLEREKLKEAMWKNRSDAELKLKQINKPNKTSSK